MAAPVRKETSWRRRWKPDLNCQPWRPFSISDKKFLVKSMFVEMDCSYEFCLWDSSTFWYEKVEHDSFKRRAKVSKKLLVVFIARFLIEMRFDEREGRLRDFCKCLILCHFNSFLLYRRAYFKDNFLV